MPLLIRPMQLADISQVHHIESQVHRAPWEKNILKQCVQAGYDSRVLESDEEEDKVLLGYIISRYSFNSCHVLNLCIAKEHQKKGHGHYLINQMFKTFKRPDIDTVYLEVRPSNLHALALYEKNGFVQTDVKKDYYTDGKHKEDAIVLVKAIL